MLLRVKGRPRKSKEGGQHTRTASPPPCPMSDPWATLGVPRGAHPDAVKAAFRKRALALHPDTASGDAAAFARLKAAYDAVLSGAAERGVGGASSAAATADNPYASTAWRRPGGGRPCPPPPPRSRTPFTAFLRALALRTTRGDALAHAGMASVALVGAAVAAYAGDAAWREANRGKLFEDVVAERERRRREKGGGGGG